MDADLLLEQEEQLSKMKGKFRKRDNPAEVAKLKETLARCQQEEEEIFSSLAQTQSEDSELTEAFSQMIPGFYSNLRRMKNLGDKKMNELLLKQINIFMERFSEVSNQCE